MILVPGDLFYALIAVQFTHDLTKLVHDVLLMKLEPGWSVSRFVRESGFVQTGTLE